MKRKFESIDDAQRVKRTSSREIKINVDKDFLHDEDIITLQDEDKSVEKKKKPVAIALKSKNSKTDVNGYKVGPWTPEEDSELLEFMDDKNRKKKWSVIGLSVGRSGKACRERWYNQINPTLKKGDWDDEENEKLYELHKIHGNKWVTISKEFENRSENDIKNRCNSKFFQTFLLRDKKYIGSPKHSTKSHSASTSASKSKSKSKTGGGGYLTSSDLSFEMMGDAFSDSKLLTLIQAASPKKEEKITNDTEDCDPNMI